MHNLSENQIEAFINNGFIKIENAFPKAIAQSCVELLWQEMNCNPDDATAWTQPVIRIGELSHTGSVYLCHPFIVHRAQNHNGTTPKFMAQPALMLKNDLNINEHKNVSYPVAMAILKGLEQ
jgi:hypothetical protein